MPKEDFQSLCLYNAESNAILKAREAAGEKLDLSKIKILRREGGGQRAIPFDYAEVERGRHLEQNVLLQGGDTVVVP